MWYTLVGIYIVGFILTLTILKFFGKKFGFDFDSVSVEDRWPDDWDSNAEAYTAFSLFWPLTLIIGVVFGSVALVFNFCKWYIDLEMPKK